MLGGRAGVQLGAVADFTVQVEVVDEFRGPLTDILRILVPVYARHFHFLKFTVHD